MQSCILYVILFALSFQCTQSTSVAAPELYVFWSINLQVNSSVNSTLNMINQAIPFGYTGMVLDDYKLSVMQYGYLPDWYYTNLNQVLVFAQSKNFTVVPYIYPYGYSDAILTQDLNLAEPQPVIGAPFTVSSDGKSLILDNFYTGPVNGQFSQYNGNNFVGYGWTYQDTPGSRTFADTSVYHSAPASLRIGAGSGNARVVQAGLSIGTNKQVYISFYIRTSGFSGGVNLEVLDSTNNYPINYNILQVSNTQDWTLYEIACNTAGNQLLNLYLGVWGTSSGNLWFDDVSIVGTALINVVQRSGAPLKIYNSTTAFTQGQDYNPVVDQGLINNGYFNNYHAPTPVTLPSSTRLQPGQKISMDYYAVAVVYNSQVGSCLTASEQVTYMQQNIAVVSTQFNKVTPDTGYFLEYDEMRHMHTCAQCKAAASTPGQLLSNHVVQSSSIIRQTTKPSRLYFWNDMFDPNHNARNNYYYVDGDISGSWNGLAQTGVTTIIMNWNLGNLQNSLKFFQSLNLGQIVAGYYDSGNGTQSGNKEMSDAKSSGVTNIIGWMYTTWENDYSQLQSYANAIKSQWPPN